MPQFFIQDQDPDETLASSFRVFLDFLLIMEYFQVVFCLKHSWTSVSSFLISQKIFSCKLFLLYDDKKLIKCVGPYDLMII